MLKRIALFPVSAMILCSIVSLSSGLGYETHSIFFLIPVFFYFWHVLFFAENDIG